VTRILSPFCVNDWDIKHALTAILVLQFALWGVIGVDALGFHVPIIRELIASAYLLFVPGILVLRILNVHKLNQIESLLYSVGFSITFTMVIGLLLSSTFQALGLSRPLSTVPLLTLISAAVLALCALAYLKDKEFRDPRFIDISSLRAPPALCLFLLPFLSIFGTYTFNFYNTNVLLILLLLIFGLIVILIGFGRLIPARLYPLAVFSISVSLVFHTSLISSYVWGYDIQLESYLANSVIGSGFWNASTSLLYNSVPSVVIFPPSFSVISGMNIDWVFKVIFPLLFSLVPLGLFRIYQKQTSSDRIAALSCFFFMSFYFFYTGLLATARQELADLFVVVFILLILSRWPNGKAKRSLSIVALFSIPLSHYSTAYFFIILLVSAWAILHLEDFAVTAANFLSRLSARHKQLYRKRGKPKQSESNGLSGVLVLLFIIVALAWGLYSAGSQSVANVLALQQRITLADFFNPQATQGPQLAIASLSSPLHNAARYFYLVSLFFIGVGIVALLIGQRQIKFTRTYRALAVASIGLLAASTVVPYFAASIGTDRLIHFSLIFLAPFAAIGAIVCIRVFARLFGGETRTHLVRFAPALFAVFLVVLFMFNNGLIYEIAHDNPQSIALDKNVAYPVFNQQDVVGGEWLFAAEAPHSANGTPWFYADSNYYQLFMRFGMPEWQFVNYPRAPGNTYVFLGTYNLEHGAIASLNTEKAILSWTTTPLGNLAHNRSKIYDNGGANVFF